MESRLNANWVKKGLSSYNEISKFSLEFAINFKSVCVLKQDTSTQLLRSPERIREVEVTI